MSTRARRSVGGGGRHFPVGRRLHVPVVDTGCGCRPRRPRLLSLPSFLKPSLSKPVPARSASHSSSYFPSSSSTASFSSSSSATYTTNCSSSYSSNYDYYYSHGYSAATKQQQDPPTKELAPAPATKRQLSTKKKRYVEKAAAAEEGVGVAVEKESSDPLADFRESMVQMVVEMGLCDWDDLSCMLRRLLALNAPRHHAAILTAFTEVCAQLAAPPAPPPPAYHRYRR